MAQQRWSLGLGVLVLMFATAVTSPASGDEVWVAPTYQQDVGGFGIGSNTIWPATLVSAARLAWAVPDNLQTFQGAKVVLIPHSPGGAATLNVFVCAAENGNPVAAACAGPFTQAFTGVPNQLSEVEIGPMLASRIGVPGANYLAILAYSTPTTTTDHIVGLRFAYAPKPMAGVATLGANVFSGAQAAPAFVGDGSGLTNLPPGPQGPPGSQGPIGPQGPSGFGGVDFVMGYVASDCSKVRGTGWTSATIGSGQCRITFTTPFSDVPTATATGSTAGNTASEAGRMVMIQDLTTANLDVHRFAGTVPTTNSNTAFYFIVIGPH